MTTVLSPTVSPLPAIITLGKLTDFMQLPVEITASSKIKFNRNPSNPKKKAWDLLEQDSKEWLTMNSWKTKQANNNLKGANYLISFAQYYPYGPDYYIFGGIYKVSKVEPEVFNNIGYDLELTDLYKPYIKKLIVKIEKPIGRDTYTRHYSTIQDQLNPLVIEAA